MTTVIKQVGKYQLYKADMKGLYAVSDDNEVSLWFDEDTKDELVNLSDDEFIKECKELLN